MNMSANTAGQPWGYLKRRFRKQDAVTSQAAGTVNTQLSGTRLSFVVAVISLPASEERLLD